MIESPLIQEIEAKNSHGLILALLQSRFKNVPEDITEELTNTTALPLALRKLATLANL
jgi:non-ribosomal peptide synthetase component F